MSTVSPIASPVVLTPTVDPAARAGETARSGSARSTAVTVPAIAPTTADIVTELGLLGLRTPRGGDINVLLAQTLLAADQTRSDAEQREALSRSNVVLGTLLGMSNGALTAKLAADTATRVETETQRTAAVADRTRLQGEVEAKQGAVDAKQGEVDAARTAVANAKTDEERAAAQARLGTLSGQLATLQGQLAAKKGELADAAETVARLASTLVRLTGEIAATGQQINAFGSLVQSVAALLSTGLRNQETGERAASNQTDTHVERLFETIAQMGLERGRAANPLLAEGPRPADRDEPAEEAPARIQALAAALAVAFADLLGELERVEPLQLARPADQTGRERFRLEV